MKFYLIGGKTNKESNYLEKVFLSKTFKETPVILYFGHASYDLEDSVARFKEQMNGLNYKLVVYKEEQIDILLEECDICYFGGGITQKIVAELANIKDKLINSNKLLVGSSAGANMWFKAGMGDYYSFVDNFHTYNYKMVKGYGIINATMCPHYQNEDLIIYNDIVKKYDCNGFAIENDTALFINGNEMQVYKADKKRSIYMFEKKNDYKMISLYEGIIYKMEC